MMMYYAYGFIYIIFTPLGNRKWKKGSAKVGHQFFDRVQQQNIFKSIDLLQNNLKR